MAPSLNPAQRAAVEHDTGPLLVLAGAGSGKTRVVTHRIARLIERGVASRAILAMTFTNKAAAEMRQRVTDLVGESVARELEVSTFHRFGLRVLGSEHRALGLRGGKFAIFDQTDSMGVVREILREVRTGKSYDVAAILARISARKNELAPAEQGEQRAASKLAEGDDYAEIAALVYPRYVAALRTFQAFDFDDLVCEVALLWRRRPEVLARWRARFRYLLVDEYQDTNAAQLELVRLLGGEHNNVCVVGDDDQSIYAWRGADVRNILDFEAHFPGAKVVKLEQNYRSVAPVLDVANAVIGRATARRHGKVLVPTRAGGEKVELVVCADAEVEASFVGAEVQRLVEGGRRPRDIAVLYRSNLSSALVESALRERQIPMRMIGGRELYERKEVKDLVAYLRLAIDPHDEMSLRRVCNYPARGIGEVAMGKLVAHATARGRSLWWAFEQAHEVRELPAAAVEGCRGLVRVIDATRARLDRREPSAEVARALAVEIGLKEDLYAGSGSNQVAARRWGNVEGILGLLGRRDERGLGDKAALAELLRFLALREEGEERDVTDRVTLTTMHGAKGLEFGVVFVIGVEEGLVPHARTLDDRATDAPIAGADAATSLEEERRLFYVAITRARDRLLLCRARQRALRGKMAPRVPSRFLLDIPAELLQEREALALAAPEPAKTMAGAAAVLAALASNAGSAPPRRRS